MKDNSPFTPGSPVPYELFVGRKSQIDEILKFSIQSKKGKQENHFLIGDRGIGKSSLAAFLCKYLREKENYLTIHVFLGGVTTLEELVQHIFEEFLKISNTKSWFDKVKGIFGNSIQQVGLLGLSVGFKPSKEALKQLVYSFPEALNNVIEKIKDDKSGFFIVLDDLNGLGDTPDFANWYKSFVDKVATHYPKFPVNVLLCGLPEVRDKLSNHQESLMRIFRIFQIDKLSKEDVSEFFKNSFNRVDIKVDKEALDLLEYYSSGLPIIMHEIGDSVFWIDNDNIIDKDDALKGIFDAAKNIGKKYLDPKVYNAIRSERYRSILRKLGQFGARFKRSEIFAKLNKKEEKVFDLFLKKMRTLGIINLDKEKGRGAYVFVNQLYPVYILLESLNIEKK